MPSATRACAAVRRKVVHLVSGTAPCRIEDDEVGRHARLEQPAIVDAEGGGGVEGEPADRLLSDMMPFSRTRWPARSRVSTLRDGTARGRRRRRVPRPHTDCRGSAPLLRVHVDLAETEHSVSRSSSTAECEDHVAGARPAPPRSPRCAGPAARFCQHFGSSTTVAVQRLEIVGESGPAARRPHARASPDCDRRTASRRRRPGGRRPGRRPRNTWRFCMVNRLTTLPDCKQGWPGCPVAPSPRRARGAVATAGCRACSAACCT